MMTIEIEGKDFTKSEMWLVNALRYLKNEELQKLTKQLAERCGLMVVEQNEKPERQNA